MMKDTDFEWELEDKNGIISAENPVRTAQQSGRFEELPDDYEDELD